MHCVKKTTHLITPIWFTVYECENKYVKTNNTKQSYIYLYSTMRLTTKNTNNLFFATFSVNSFHKILLRVCDFIIHMIAYKYII